MKKFIFVLVSILALTGLADISSPIYGSLTSIAQLEHAHLKAGQFAYYEKDGAVEMLVGANDELKELRVCDPAALSGYRIRDFDTELTIAADTRMVNTEPGKYRFTVKNHASNPDGYDYISCSTNTIAKSDTEYYQKSGDTYVRVYPAEGSLLDDTYYHRNPYWILTITVYSKDHNFYKLDYSEDCRPSGIGDFYELSCTDSIEYDGRVATITRKVVSLNPTNNDWFDLYDFHATTLAIGDWIHYTDLTKTKIFFKDKEYYEQHPGGTNSSHKANRDGNDYDAEGFDLSNVRYWAKHLYDGNRGEHWSVYPAYHDVNFDTFYGLSMASVKFTNNLTNRWKMISVDGNLQFTTHDIPIMRLELLESDSGSTDECAFTGIHQDLSTHNWILEFSFQEAVEPATINILWRPTLEYGDWMPIGCTLTYNNAKTEYTATVPAVYSEAFRSGFWKIYVPGDPGNRRLRVNATISVIGSDGKYYKLTFPSGGGAVTATLDENQGY